VGNESPKFAQTFISGRKAGDRPKFALNFTHGRDHPNLEKILSKLWPGPISGALALGVAGPGGSDGSRSSGRVGWRRCNPPRLDSLPSPRQHARRGLFRGVGRVCAAECRAGSAVACYRGPLHRISQPILSVPIGPHPWAPAQYARKQYRRPLPGAGRPSAAHLLLRPSQRIHGNESSFRL